jgi:hypothetical protein
VAAHIVLVLVVVVVLVLDLCRRRYLVRRVMLVT